MVPVYSPDMKDIDPGIVRPLWNRVLIEEDAKPEVSEGGGIILPATAKDAKYSTPATVLAVGRGKPLKNGRLAEIELRKGDRIVLGKQHGALISGERIRMVDADVIDGVYEPD